MQALRHAQAPACYSPRGSRDEVTAELERKERVSARRITHPGELRARQFQPKPFLEQSIQRGQTQRLEPHPFVALLPKRMLGLETCLSPGGLAQRREQANRLLAQAPQRDLKHRGGRCIQPLEIIQSEHDRAVLGEHANHVEQRQPDSARIRSHLARRREQKRYLERVSPRR